MVWMCLHAIAVFNFIHLIFFSFLVWHKRSHIVVLSRYLIADISENHKNAMMGLLFAVAVTAIFERAHVQGGAYSIYLRLKIKQSSKLTLYFHHPLINLD